jgi:hypothetical protein
METQCSPARQRSRRLCYAYLPGFLHVLSIVSSYAYPTRCASSACAGNFQILDKSLVEKEDCDLRPPTARTTYYFETFVNPAVAELDCPLYGYHNKRHGRWSTLLCSKWGPTTIPFGRYQKHKRGSETVHGSSNAVLRISSFAFKYISYGTVTFH